MPIRNFRPTSPGRRNSSGFTFEEITKKKPEKNLLVSKKRSSGRGHGKISVRRRGGGHKRQIRIVDFKREKIGDMTTEMFYHFFKSFCDGAKLNANIKVEGTNEHHKIESIFKAFAKCIKTAVSKNQNKLILPSTKGVL